MKRKAIPILTVMLAAILQLAAAQTVDNESRFSDLFREPASHFILKMNSQKVSDAHATPSVTAENANGKSVPGTNIVANGTDIETAADPAPQPAKDNVYLADPFVLKYDGAYYLYGTSSLYNTSTASGIPVFKSTNLKNWKGPVGATDGFAITREDSYQNKGVMGAYVVSANDKFYLYYVATRPPHIAVAVSDSPLGPFIHEKVLNIDGKSIAPHIFIDDDGKKYLYFNKLIQGNKIFVAELNDDLLSIKENTVKECLRATEPWEHTDKNPHPNWPVVEGPAVLKHESTYYLFYTANHFINPDYNVGYATSSSPLGPWTKYKGNPILKKSADAVGIGSGEFIRNAEGELSFFYHAHYNRKKVSPRKVVYSKVKFVPAKNGGPDIVKVDSEKHFPQVSGRF